MIIINPGTQASTTATEVNALAIAGIICEDLSLPTDAFRRDATKDRDGWFKVSFTANGKSVDVDIPGDDPEVTCNHTPFKSRRLYVDGSSWLYGYAIGFIARGLGMEEE